MEQRPPADRGHGNETGPGVTRQNEQGIPRWVPVVLLVIGPIGFALAVFLASQRWSIGDFVFGLAFFGIPAGLLYAFMHYHVSTAKCPWCKNRFPRKQAIRPTTAEAQWMEISDENGNVLRRVRREVLFCSAECRDAYEDDSSIKCFWCPKSVPTKDVIWYPPLDQVKSREQSHPFHSAPCMNAFRASDGVKEDRKRIIYGEGPDA